MAGVDAPLLCSTGVLRAPGNGGFVYDPGARVLHFG